MFPETIKSFPPRDQDALRFMYPESADQPTLSEDEILARTGRSRRELIDLAVELLMRTWARRSEDAEYQRRLAQAGRQVFGQ
jgi:hypothetical protein